MLHPLQRRQALARQLATIQPQVRCRRQALVALLVSLFAAGQAMAGTVNTSDPFYNFLQTVNSYAHGALGISICVVAVLFGAIVGIGRNSPTSALTGVAFALFIYFAPETIASIFAAGAVLA